MHRRHVLTGAAVALAGCTSMPEGPDAAEAETLVREQINEDRQAAGVGVCSQSETLQDAAVAHSRDMHERDFYAHENPDGELPWHRVPCNASENIHRGEIGEMRNQGSDETYDTHATDELAAYVVDGWRESAGHRENMLDPGWQSIGVGIYIGDDDAFFATAMFC